MSKNRKQSINTTFYSIYEILFNIYLANHKTFNYLKINTLQINNQIKSFINSIISKKN